MAYQNQQQIEAVVRGFESLTIPKDEFTHREHLTVAMWYVKQFDEARALDQMRAGLLKFLTHHDVDPNKYNETITLFWLKLVRGYALRLDPDLTIVEATNAVVEDLSNSRLVFEYYSETLLNSSRAKCSWVEPDLKSLKG